MTRSDFIPEKHPKQKSAKLKTADEAPKLPKDLEDKWGAVQACATAFNVMQDGSYKFSYHKSVQASLVFLKTLYEQTVEDALKHPQAALIPELKEELDKKAAADGKKN